MSGEPCNRPRLNYFSWPIGPFVALPIAFVVAAVCGVVYGPLALASRFYRLAAEEEYIAMLKRVNQ